MNSLRTDFSLRTGFPSRPVARPRAGVTLTEVLMSLLVMGVGVVSVATLFPLAVLRGARATQLTAGTMLKLNAAETVAYSRSPSLATPLPASIGDVPVGAPGASADDVDFRNAFLTGASPGVPRDAMLLDPDANGDPNSFGPADNSGEAVNDWAGDAYPPRKFVVDPLGAAVLAGAYDDPVTPFVYGVLGVDDIRTGQVPTAQLIDQFGAVLTADASFGGRVLRFAWPYPWEVIAAAENGDSFTRADGLSVPVQSRMIESAYALVGREGDYGTEIDGDAVVQAVAAGGGFPAHLLVTFDDGDAAAGSLEEFFTQAEGAGDRYPAPGADTARAVLFGFDGRSSAAVPLRELFLDAFDAASQTGVDVIPAGTSAIRLALPDGAFLSSVGLRDNAGAIAFGAPVTLRVRLERPDRRYSWMLTCRRAGTGRLQTEVAVFFNRALSAEDESVWRSVKLSEEPDDTRYALFYNSATQSAPLVTGGAWLLDMGELKWLQVGRVLEEDQPAGDLDPQGRLNGGTAWGADVRVLTYQLSGATPRVNEAGNRGPLFATFPRGVVEVYPLDPPQEAK